MLLLLGFSALALLALGGRVAAALVDRALGLAERKIKLLEQVAQGPAIPASIPPDLYRRITKWGNAEAAESERKILLDLYNEFRDAPDPWVEVRAHLPAEPKDELPSELFSGGYMQ